MDGGNWKEMFNAACEGDLELVRFHVENGVDVNYAHPEFLATPLVACALAGQEPVALYLLEAGADPHLPSQFDGLTPIQAAQQARLPALAARLGQLGATPPPATPPARPWFRRLFVALGLVTAGCAGFQGGWESVPYVGDAPPPMRAAETPFESRQRKTLRLDALTLGVGIANQVRTHDVQVYGFVLPLSVDPRTVPTQRSEPRKTRVTLEVSGLRAGFVFKPGLARLRVGDQVVTAAAGFEFGMWNPAGQRVTAGGTWQRRPVGETLALQDRTRTYVLNIEFAIETPSPESTAIALDLSQALSAPGVEPLPVIRFAPGRWKHGYT